MLFFISAYASDMTFAFKSPAFNGVGYSAHMFTQENLARTRKQTIKDVAKNEAEQVKLQAQINSQLAAQVTDQIFNSGGQTFGIINLQGGATVTWTRSGDFATLYIFDPIAGNTTQITVPITNTLPPTG
jgi:hypothetical protein